MSPALRGALIRLARGLAYGLAAFTLAFVMENLPLLTELIPGGAMVVPVLMALLLALDKFVRAKRAELPSE